jgi:hypothetical protein
VASYNHPARRLHQLTPLRSLIGVNVLRFDGELLDPETFQDEQIMR